MALDSTRTAANTDTKDQLRSRRRQVFATAALLWPGFSVIAWLLRWKFWRAFSTEDIPAFSRLVFSPHPLVLSALMLLGLVGWAMLHLRIQSPSLRQGVGLTALALWCAVTGLLCLAFLAPLVGLRVNLGS